MHYRLSWSQLGFKAHKHSKQLVILGIEPATPTSQVVKCQNPLPEGRIVSQVGLLFRLVARRHWCRHKKYYCIFENMLTYH